MTTLRDAVRDLGKLSSTAHSALERSLNTIAHEAVRDLEATTPVDTGELAAGWRVEGTAIVNDTPYASYVIDESEIRSTLDRLDERWRQEVDRALDVPR